MKRPCEKPDELFADSRCTSEGPILRPCQQRSTLRFYSRSADALTHRELEILSAREVAEALEAPSPLAFWRAKQGVSQKALSDAAGFSQGYIADLEVGSREGDLAITKQLGRALRFEWEREMAFGLRGSDRMSMNIETGPQIFTQKRPHVAAGMSGSARPGAAGRDCAAGANAREGRDVVRTPQAHPRARPASVEGTARRTRRVPARGAAQNLRKLAKLRPMIALA
jgi:hypothetical protein